MRREVYLIIGMSALVALYYIFGRNDELPLVSPVSAPIEEQEEKNKSLLAKGGEYVYITGAVQEPGLYEVNKGISYGKVVALAGGFLPYAAVEEIHLEDTVEKGEHIHIPFSFSGNPEELLRKKKVDINRADEKELQTLKGVGPAMAKKIIDYRKEKGTFKSVEELKEVKGIGDAIFNKLKGEVTVS